MANNYLQFSTEIDNLTISEIKWWNNKFNVWSENLESDDVNTEQNANDLMSLFDLRDNNLLIIAEEFGQPELVADVIQEFLIECRPEGSFSFTWACTCSKMRLDEFYGGGVFITADSIQWFNPHFDIEMALKNWNNLVK